MPENSNSEENPAAAAKEDSGENTTISAKEEVQDEAGASGESGEDLAAKVAELEDRLMRARAEMANAAKRSQEEGRRMVMHASEQFARHFLEVADNLERALDSRAETSAQALIEGVALTLSGLQSTFASLGIETIEPAAGDRPDPHQHQTLMLEPGGSIAAGCIVRTVQKGYRMNQRLIRAAKVIVARDEAEQQQAQAKEEAAKPAAEAEATGESKS